MIATSLHCICFDHTFRFPSRVRTLHSLSKTAQSSFVRFGCGARQRPRDQPPRSCRHLTAPSCSPVCTSRARLWNSRIQPHRRRQTDGQTDCSAVTRQRAAAADDRHAQAPPRRHAHSAPPLRPPPRPRPRRRPHPSLSAPREAKREERGGRARWRERRREVVGDSTAPTVCRGDADTTREFTLALRWRVLREYLASHLHTKGARSFSNTYICIASARAIASGG